MIPLAFLTSAPVQAILPNGTFDSPDGWTVSTATGGGIANGFLRLVGVRGSGPAASRSTLPLVTNSMYRIEFDLLASGTSAVQVTLGNSGLVGADGIGVPGHKTIDVNTGDSPPNSFFIRVGSGTYDIDNIVVTKL